MGVFVLLLAIRHIKCRLPSVLFVLLIIFPMIYSGVGVARADSVIATIPVNRSPLYPAYDTANGNIYVPNHESNTVSVISGQTDTVVGNPIHVKGYISSSPVTGIAYDPDNGNIYVADWGDNDVTVISGQTNTVVGNPIPILGSGGLVGSAPVGIAFDSINGNLYVANYGDKSVSIISGKTNSVVGVITPVGNGHPYGIAFDSNNGNVYVTNYAGYNDDSTGNTVSVISGQTNTVVGNPIPVGNTPLGIAYDSSNGNLYVTNEGDNSVSVIAGQTNTVVGSPIPVGSLPYGIAFDSANKELYVANSGSNTISVIATTPPQQPPQTTITSAVDVNGATIQSGGTTFSSSIKFTFTSTAGTNPIAGFECSLDNGAFSSCSSPTTLTNLAVGSYTFQVRAVDTSGNRDPTPPSFSWTIIAPPTKTTITSAVDGNGAAVQNGGTTLSNSIRFTFTATPGTNPIAGFVCNIDNSPFSSCTSPATFNSLAVGSHKFTVSAVDTLGNNDPNPAIFSWTILTPAQGIEQLIQMINGMHLNLGTQTSLDAQLNGILTMLSLPSNNNQLPACPHLNAFVNTVVPDYLHAGQLNPNQAAQIIQSAQNIQKALGCPISFISGMGASAASPSLQSPLIPNSQPQQQPIAPNTNTISPRFQPVLPSASFPRTGPSITTHSAAPTRVP
jgi:YVTN family beta-propeller protein